MFAQSALISETGRLKKFAVRLTRNHADADDLLQSTCLRALEKSDRFIDGSNLFGWTSKIMFNLFVSGYRRRAKFETQYDPDIYLEMASIPAAQQIESELADVKRAILKLSAAHRDVVVLICMKGMRYDEVSALLQLPVGTIKSRLSRARSQIKLLLAPAEHLLN